MNSGSSLLREQVNNVFEIKRPDFSILIKGTIFFMIPRGSLEISIHLHLKKNIVPVSWRIDNEGGVRMVVEEIVEDLSNGTLQKS